MGDKDLAVKSESQLVHAEYSNDQIRILTETVAKGCTQTELGFFINVCRLKRLDPFSAQVHCVKRYDSELGRDKITVQIGIDGFRVIAARTKDLAGITEPEYDSEDEEHPKWAHVIVYRYGRNNEKIAYPAKARWSEYVQTKRDGNPNRMWKKMPYLMLGKVAEALALRKAFPDELSGMYSDEEMGQADSESHDPQKPPVSSPRRASERSGQSAPTNAPSTAHDAGNGANQGSPRLDRVSGVIEKVQTAKSGVTWVTMKGAGLARVPVENVDDRIVAGSFIAFDGDKRKDSRIGDYYEVVEIQEISIVQEAETSNEETSENDSTPEKGEDNGVFYEMPDKEEKGPLSPEMESLANDIFPDGDGGAKTVQEMVNNGDLKPASAIPHEVKKGTIGVARAKRIYSLCNINSKVNHGFNEKEIKKILASLPFPLEHLRDLELGMYEQFELWATGKDDYREFLKTE